MIEWLERTFGICFHKWMPDYQYYDKIIWVCEKCGAKKAERR